MRVVLLAVTTLDGKIARHTDELTTWSSREDKQLFARVTREAGVCVMGRHTYETMTRPLPDRLNLVMTRSLPTSTPPPGVEFTDARPAHVLEDLAQRGYSTVVVSGGAQIYRAFLEAGLVDELLLTLEPMSFGAGISLFGDDKPLEHRFTLLELQRLNESTLHLRYRVNRE
ncbi:MAG TPA: dihydrofolate reductase family protein [Ktedonobacterales bacterium]